MGREAAARRTRVLAITAATAACSLSAFAATADARRVKGYEYKVTAVSGSIPYQSTVQSSDGFSSQQAAQIDIDGAAQGKASFDLVRRPKEAGKVGDGSFVAPGQFSASYASPFGACSEGPLALGGNGLSFAFYNSGSRVLVNFDAAAASLEACDVEMSNVATFGLHKAGTASDPYSKMLSAPRRRFLRKRFTLRFANNRTDSFSGPAASGTTTSNSALTVKFKRTKKFFR